jgi:hypothetical protein
LEIKIQNIEKLFKYLLEYSFLLLPAFYFIGKTKKEKQTAVLALYGVVFFCLLHFYKEIPRSYRKIYQSLYTFLEYSFFTYIVWYYIRDGKFRKVIFFFSILFFVFQIIHFLVAKHQKLDSIAIGFETIVLFFFIFTYFKQFFKTNISKNMYEYPSFWLIAGILIYLGCSFFFNILVNHIPKQQFDSLWHFTYIPEIIKNILFAIVIIWFPSQSIEHSFSSQKSKDIPNLDII